MTDQDGIPARIVRQFSDVGDSAAVWRALDLVLETDAFLNLGYSRWYQTHLVGNPQRRLVDVIGRDLVDRLPETNGVALLDVGCGRGGPARRLARRYGFAVTGVDLVPYNVELAAERARVGSQSTAYLVGDATRLPVRNEAFPAATAIDSPVYIDAKDRFYDELHRVLEPGGIAVVSDLVTADARSADDRTAIDAFATAWDMPPIPTRSAYLADLSESELDLLGLRDITANSVGRFDKWARLFLGVADGPLAGPLRRALAAKDIDLDEVVDAVAAARPALPLLRHVVVHVRRPG